MKMHCRNLLVILSIVSASSALTRADVLTISGATDPSKIKDNTIFGGFVNNSGGGTLGFFSGKDTMGRVLRGLIAFDVSAIPSYATVTDVQLTLIIGQIGGSGGGGGDTSTRDVGLHLLGANWGEGTAGSSSTTFTGTGNGFAASTGDATWNQRFFNTTNWTNPGAVNDFASAYSGHTNVAFTTATPAVWSSSVLGNEALVNDVQGWVSNPSNNFGWLVKHEDEGPSTTNRGFWSREAPIASNRPQLQITYTVPEPAMALPILLVCAGLRFRVRR